MTPTHRIYLDHAATSWPKSDEVIEAMVDATRSAGAAGRGGYQSAMVANKYVQSVRRELSRLINAQSPSCISLHGSGTAALNTAIHGIVRAGDHVVTTAAEHNSVLRPLFHLQQSAGVKLTIVPCDSIGNVSADDVLSSVRDETRMVAMTHASNVTGAVQPITEVALGLKSRRAVFLVDAAQTLGYLPIDVQASGVDLLAAPGHKGTGGPLGTGCLYVAPSIQPIIQASIQGGTGSSSESLEMPSDFPGKLEAGNLNVPALAGWATALSQLEQRGVDAVSVLLRSHSTQMHEMIDGADGVRLLSVAGELAILSLQLPPLSPADLAAILDSEFAIEARAGFHCAALIHKYLCADPVQDTNQSACTSGTLRLSAGFDTTEQQIASACEAIETIAESCKTQ